MSVRDVEHGIVSSSLPSDEIEWKGGVKSKWYALIVTLTRSGLQGPRDMIKWAMVAGGHGVLIGAGSRGSRRFSKGKSRDLRFWGSTRRVSLDACGLCSRWAATAIFVLPAIS